MLQQHMVKKILNLRTAFPAQVTLGRVGNLRTGPGPSITHYHVRGANASNWQAWNDQTGFLQRTCSGYGQAAALQQNRPVPGWFGIVTAPVKGYSKPQLGHHSREVTKVVENSGAPSFDLPRYALTHPDFSAKHWYDVLRNARCRQHRLVLAHSVVGVEPDGSIGNKAKMVKVAYLRHCGPVHPDKTNFADSEDRMMLLVKAHELLQSELG